jgi:hypothetical protein
VLVATATAACGSGSHSAAVPRGLPTTTSTSTLARPPTTAAGCSPTPRPGTPLGWLPQDLPLPPGTYASADTTNGAPVHRALLVVPLALRDFVVFALREWPKAGYRLGRGDAEANEAEDSFAKDVTSGAFRARAVYCDPNKIEVLFVYGTRPLPSTPTTGGRALTP